MATTNPQDPRLFKIIDFILDRTMSKTIYYPYKDAKFYEYLP